MPAPMISATQEPASSDVSKPNSTGRAPSGLAINRTVCFRHNTKLALRAADESEQIITGGVEVLAAQFEHRAIHQHHFHAEQIIWW